MDRKAMYKLSYGLNPVSYTHLITGDYWCEGPAPLFVDDVLYVYFDKYRNHQ